MPRPSRKHIVIPGEFYHVYARGNDGKTLYKDAEDFEYYQALLRELLSLFKVGMYHFTLMPNHVHLLLRPEDESLSQFMKCLQNRYTKYFCKKYAFRGHLWQGRYKNKHLYNDAYLYACGNYIEMNPVRAGLVSEPASWIYSSFRHYAFGVGMSFIQTNPFYIGLGQTKSERQNMYRQTIDKTRIDA